MVRKYVEALDETSLVNLVQELVRIRTPNPPADYSVISEKMRSLMDSLGLEVKILEGEKGKPNVVGLWRGAGSGPTLLLDAHMDVVPEGDGWEVDPWEAQIRDGAIWGRGTADLKQSLAIMVHVVDALKKKGFAPRGNLILSATNDDETAGKMGLKYVIEKGLREIGWPMPDFHLLLEAGDWNVNVAYKGRLWVRIGVRGIPAHGGAPEKGVNAILKMTELISTILDIPRKTHPLIGADSINVGTIVGGEKTNMVPAYCETTFDYRFVPPRNSEDALQEIRNAVEARRRGDPKLDVAMFEVFEQRDPLEIQPDAPEILLLRECISEERGTEAKISGSLSAGNAYWSLKNGIMGTMTGPGNADVIHTNREHITLKELMEGARIVLSYVIRYIG